MLLESTSNLFVVHPTLSLAGLNDGRTRITATIQQADFDRSILDQISDCYDLLVLDWGLERPDARGVLDAFRHRVPDIQILVIADDVPIHDPIDRGANELLINPFPDENLYSTIERLLLQKAYDQSMDALFRLSTERALLESELQSGLDVTDQYQSVVSNLSESRKRAAAIRDELSSEEFDQAFRYLLE